MATDLGQLVYTLTLDDEGFQGQLDSAKDKVVSTGDEMGTSMDETAEKSAGLGGAFSGMAGQFVEGAVIFTVAQKALTALKDTVTSGIQNFEQWQQNQAQLNNSLKVTGDASGQTIQSLNKYADTLSSQTGITTNAINSAQLMLLNYKAIGGQVFPQATEAVTNFATVLAHGAVPSTENMQMAAKLLGRALEDPTKGASALTRAGVTLSLQQQDQIKTMAKAGDIAGAQTYLLNQLADVIGGKATTASHTLSGEMAKLRSEMEDIEIKVGQDLVKAFHALEPALTTALDFLVKHKEIIVVLAGAILGLAIAIGVALVTALWGMVSAGVAAVAALWPIILIAAAVALAAYEIITHWSDLKQWFDDFMHWIKEGFDDVWGYIDRQWQDFIKVNEEALEDVKKAWDKAWADVKQAVVDVIHAIGLVLTPLFDVYKFIFETMYAIAMWVWHGIYNDAIKPVMDMTVQVIIYTAGIIASVWDSVYNTAKAVWNAIYGSVIKPVFDDLVAGIEIVGGIIDSIWQAIDNVIRPILVAIGDQARDTWNFIVSIWQGAVSWFEGLFSSVSKAGSAATNGITGFFSQMWNDIKNDAKDALNDVIDILDDLIKSYNDTVGKIPGAPKIASIPHFASGVSNFSGGLALVGENGPELVNLPGGSSVINNSQTQSMMGGNSYNFAGANFNFSTADAVDEFFSIGNRNSQLESQGGSPLAGTTRV